MAKEVVDTELGRHAAIFPDRQRRKGKFTFYADPSISIAWGITVGSDRALWFTSQFGDSIGRLRILNPR